ncbi:hypothetical protein LC605_27465 [Nostoc sp. CHAB 5836]|uniref:hypothetical protein n=1 Tax=Nostoc sp. CHAB 5836 TaxID=2780404 RepID=UPI001E5E0AA7|nr:hypothetical protein [Nostoc sp. CHAB 5836]MCC5618761.1 hypothetical protein [Nostoc sp. CHAB 5836]
MNFITPISWVEYHSILRSFWQKNKKGVGVGWVEERNPTEDRGLLGNALLNPTYKY